jgi:hypothetical protein
MTFLSKITQYLLGTQEKTADLVNSRQIQMVVPVVDDGAGNPVVMTAGSTSADGYLSSLNSTATTISNTATAANAILTRSDGYLNTCATDLALLVGATKSASATGVITASDVTTYSPPLRVITAQNPGTIALMLSGDSSNVITITVDANQIITCFSIKKVMGTGTTATPILAAL